MAKITGVGSIKAGDVTGQADRIFRFMALEEFIDDGSVYVPNMYYTVGRRQKILREKAIAWAIEGKVKLED